MNTVVNDPEMLETLYWQEGLSMWRIAQRLDCSETAVRNAMIRFGIDRRDSAYNGNQQKPEENKVHIRSMKSGYERIEHSYKGERFQLYHHQLIAVANGVDPNKVFSQKYHTHHKNEVKWDNRPQNLEVMTASEHMKHHADESNFGERRKYSDEDMLDWIRSFVAEFGYVPASTDLEGWPGPTVAAYEQRFESWRDAVNKAGWKVPNHPTDKNGRRIGYEEPKQYNGD